MNIIETIANTNNILDQLDSTGINKMKRFIGTKLINAKPMTRLDYNIFRGWTLPADENGEDKGFLVEYVDGGHANTKEYVGYVSWSPEEIFNNSYSNAELLNASNLIEEFKAVLSVWGIK